jgi:hypothetical protein
MEISGRDLRWLLEGVLKTMQPDLAEHRGYARAKLSDLGRVRGRKPKAEKPKPTKKR